MPVREDCRAHEISCDDLYLLPWRTRIHTTALGFPFSCHAEPRLSRTESAHRGVFATATRETGRDKTCIWSETTRTHTTAAFLCFHSCAARVVAWHQERACGVRKKPISIRILIGRKPFSHDSRGVFSAVRRQQQPATPRTRRVHDPERTRLR